MKILFVEPYFGGSHREFAQGLVSHSSHDIDLLTLPDRNWTWRIHGSALYFGNILRSSGGYDGIITSSMMRLSDLKSFVGPSLPPVLVYFHESQLTYPTASGEKKDMGMAMGDISTALMADRVLFNSQYHRQAFITAIVEIMVKAPDCPLSFIEDEILKKSAVVYPGLCFSPNMGSKKSERDKPLIIWNHRWSYDKNAPSFFYALDVMVKRGLEFEVALLGECPGWVPREFEKAKDRLGNRLIQYGYLENRDDYCTWLNNGSIALSTAKQENFGMSMVEAMKHGCIPLLPHRLSYPEILPKAFHQEFLYTCQKDFLEKLERLLMGWRDYGQIRHELSHSMDRFSWPEMINQYDKEIERVFR